MGSSIKLYSWNVNGIRAVLRKNALQPFIDTHQPDILCIQETKAQEGQVDIDLQGYGLYWNSAERKGYSGTAIFTKQKPINIANGFPKEIRDTYDFSDSYGDTSTEGRVIAAEFATFFLVTVYTPNAKDDLTRIPMRLQWDPAFLAYCQQLEKKKPVVFCGDLNVAHKAIDLARPKENEGKKGFTQEERSGFDAFEAAGYIDTFRTLHPDTTDAYTWWSAWGGARARNVGWRIDYFMVSNTLKSDIKEAAIHADVMGSDHCPVSLVLEI